MSFHIAGSATSNDFENRFSGIDKRFDNLEVTLADCHKLLEQIGKEIAEALQAISKSLDERSS